MLNSILSLLAQSFAEHGHGSAFYQRTRLALREEVDRWYGPGGEQAVVFDGLGKVAFPYRKLGAVDTLNMFDLDEVIILSFYWANRSRYRRVLDLGANIGLHSIVLSRCGYAVRAFEPDPDHISALEKNLALNGIRDVEVRQCAVSDRDGEQEFVRVVGNTTGSHLAGAKKNPYGELVRFPVRLEDIRRHVGGVDLMKVDVEGHEREVLFAVPSEKWAETDALVEVENPENARAIFEHFKKLQVGLFAQKINWGPVQAVGDMPTSYREGTLFISMKGAMPWGK